MLASLRVCYLLHTVRHSPALLLCCRSPGSNTKQLAQICHLANLRHQVREGTRSRASMTRIGVVQMTSKGDQAGNFKTCAHMVKVGTARSHLSLPMHKPTPVLHTFVSMVSMMCAALFSLLSITAERQSKHWRHRLARHSSATCFFSQSAFLSWVKVRKKQSRMHSHWMALS